MHKQCDSYNDFVKLLDGLGFSNYYSDEISKNNYRVNYGKRKGTVDFDSVKCASEKYIYETSGKYSVGIDQQLSTLEIPDRIDENELVLQCIEVFDWGRVQASNIIKAINLHRDDDLSSYLLQCKEWFENDDTLEISLQNIAWSSGWTKVYSFMFSKTTIYDSRVAAFINYMLVSFYRTLSSERDRNALKLITQRLVSIKGTAERARCVSASDRNLLGIRMKASNDKRNFISNKAASWLIRYISEIEFSNQSQFSFRQIDKAMFMLGFDISQIDKSVGFS